MNNLYLLMIDFMTDAYPLMVTATEQEAVAFGKGVASSMIAGSPTDLVADYVSAHGLGDWHSVSVIEFTNHTQQRIVESWGPND